jgi:hypothetical protein
VLLHPTYSCSTLLFGASSQLNSMVSWCSPADWLFIRGMPAFCIFIHVWTADLGNGLMIISVLFSMSLPVNMFTTNFRF